VEGKAVYILSCAVEFFLIGTPPGAHPPRVDAVNLSCRQRSSLISFGYPQDIQFVTESRKYLGIKYWTESTCFEITSNANYLWVWMNKDGQNGAA
jgi:hypothetical protein